MARNKCALPATHTPGLPSSNPTANQERRSYERPNPPVEEKSTAIIIVDHGRRSSPPPPPTKTPVVTARRPQPHPDQAQRRPSSVLPRRPGFSRRRVAQGQTLQEGQEAVVCYLSAAEAAPTSLGLQLQPRQRRLSDFASAKGKSATSC